MDYSKTLNLPKTRFPMRANLPQREPEILARWEEMDIYGLTRKHAAGRPKFILHDGPPYANGNIHLGTALNKVLKDIVNKYKYMRGYDTPYVPGWDTHGLPIEHAAIKNLGLNRAEISTAELRKRCAEYALHFVAEQRAEFKRLGVRGDWEHPYLTLKPEYEAKQIEVFGAMAQKGYIYKGLKPVYWCTTCETALAEAEVEYREAKSDSLYVKFPLKADPTGRLTVLAPADKIYFVIWTTTTWTLPANLAVCLNPRFEYALVKTGDEYYVLAKDLVETVMQEVGRRADGIVGTFRGEELEGVECWHPFIERPSVVILGEHVTLDAGTGCVHTAPGHGLEDFEVGQKYKLPILNPVNGKGVFTEEAGKFAGLPVREATEPIVAELKRHGALLHFSTITHQYPHCWRCKDPVLFLATEQWFASVDAFRDKTLEAIKDVKWYPSWGEERISAMVRERSDWCISRQRVWGVPIPIFYCEQCGQELITPESIAAVRDLFKREGSNGWFTHSAAEILPPGTACAECGNTTFRKETDTMDVWFDSGSSHFAVLETRPELKWPCDLYLEGSDQHRGWFQSSLLTAVAVRGRAPYNAVLTHGYVVDGEGRKMSKSIGNVIFPQEIIKEFGADILRLWVASSDFKADIRVSREILLQLAEVYRKIRNTARFLLGNLYDFDPARDKVPYAELGELDRWALLTLARLTEKVTAAYENYDYHLLYHALHNFCALDMSAFYLDVIKDRLYCSTSEARDRRAAQTVLYEVLTTLVRLMAPVLTFTAEEIWTYVPGEDKEASVQLTAWPEVKKEYLDIDLEARWNELLQVRDDVAKALEKARQEGLIGTSLRARVDLWFPENLRQTYELVKRYADQLPTLFIVSQVGLHGPEDTPPAEAAAMERFFGARCRVSLAAGEKCERCWMYHEDIEGGVCPRCRAVLAEPGRRQG
ncbi:MAG: isoleucyl-tRNA synthetase [Bacillota bacterium]|nr:isoleucyl-tRNA synthetase [Bacillota bacterium]